MNICAHMAITQLSCLSRRQAAYRSCSLQNTENAMILMPRSSLATIVLAIRIPDAGRSGSHVWRIRAPDRSRRCLLRPQDGRSAPLQLL